MLAGLLLVRLGAYCCTLWGVRLLVACYLHFLSRLYQSQAYVELMFDRTYHRGAQFFAQMDQGLMLAASCADGVQPQQG